MKLLFSLYRPFFSFLTFHSLGVNILLLFCARLSGAQYILLVAFHFQLYNIFTHFFLFISICMFVCYHYDNNVRLLNNWIPISLNIIMERKSCRTYNYKWYCYTILNENPLQRHRWEKHRKESAQHKLFINFVKIQKKNTNKQQNKH